MSRPAPRVIKSIVNPRNYIALEVLAATEIFAVFLDGHPFNLRAVDNGHKYRKTSHVHVAQAFRLKNRLNKQFETDRFTVVRLVSDKS